MDDLSACKSKRTLIRQSAVNTQSGDEHMIMIMSMSCCILLDHTHIGEQHILSFIKSIRLVLQDYEHVILHTLDHAHIGDQQIPSFVDSICLVLNDHKHVTMHTPRSCPHWRSTHPFLRRFNSPSTT
jgi:hypothetical protein